MLSPATVGWPIQACRTWRPPRPSTSPASQLGWATGRSPRPASRALPPSRPEHFANGVRTFLSRSRGKEKSAPVPTVDVDRGSIALDILAVVGLEAGRNLRPPGALIHAGRFLPPHGRPPGS